MRIDIMTLFPEAVSASLDISILGRAEKKGILDIRCVQIRQRAVGCHGNAVGAGNHRQALHANQLYLHAHPAQAVTGAQGLHFFKTGTQ